MKEIVERTLHRECTHEDSLSALVLMNTVAGKGHGNIFF
jgi:hypothetical protein